MSTFMARAENITPKWHVIDADGKILGRIAAEAASILRGKHTPQYTPHVNCGDYVIIINAAKAVLSGKKLEQKEYIRHTGWIGGLKRVKYRHLMETNPEKAFELAIKGMLPHNTLGRECFKKLRVYAGAEHEHQAQILAGTGKPKAKPKAEAKPKVKAEVKAEVKTDVKPKAEAKATAKPAEKPKAEAKTTAKPKAETKATAKPKTETKATAKPKAETKTTDKPKTAPKAKAEKAEEAKQ